MKKKNVDNPKWVVGKGKSTKLATPLYTQFWQLPAVERKMLIYHLNTMFTEV